MQVKIKWVDGVCFIGESDSNHLVKMDGPSEVGGMNKGMRPMEVLLVGMGGCTSFDVLTILKKSRQKIIDCEALITAERSQDVPKVFTKIHIHFLVRGDHLDNVVVARVIKLSAEKYCSATIMLSKSVEITHDFEIIEEPSVVI